MLGIQQLIEAASAATAALPVETHAAYPVPVTERGTRCVAVLFCPSNVNPVEGLRLRPPEHVVYVHPTTGALLLFRAVLPADFGRADPIHEFLGKYDMLPGGREPDEFFALEKRLMDAYDGVLAAFIRGDVRVAPPERQAARDLLDLFPQVTEQPLQPYYQALGREFFAWLRQVTR